MLKSKAHMSVNRVRDKRIITANSRRRFSFKWIPQGIDYPIYWSLIWLSLFGLLMIASASMGLAIGQTTTLAKIVIKQVIFLILGYFSMTYLTNRFRFRFLDSTLFLWTAIGLFISLMMCLSFRDAGGAHAWIRISLLGQEITIQPSEFIKIFTPMVVAAYCGSANERELQRKAESDRRGVDYWKRPVMILGIYFFMILGPQSDLGSAAVIAMISMACFLIPHNPHLRFFQRFVIFLLVLGIVGTAAILTPYGMGLIQSLPLKAYQKNRFISAVNPFADPYGTGYQLINGLISMASGGWSGLGFGNSVRKYTQFPAANTDFILAIVVEELGIVGFLLIFIPYIIIICRLFYFAMRIKNEKAQILLVGTAMYLAVHCLFNIGGVTGLVPLTGVPLLMISSGGSSSLAFMASIGVAQSVIAQYRRGAIQ